MERRNGNILPLLTLWALCLAVDASELVNMVSKRQVEMDSLEKFAITAGIAALGLVVKMRMDKKIL